MPPGDRSGKELRDYLSVIRRRKGIIILGVLVVAATAVAVSSLQTPVYEGQARVLLEAPAALFGTPSAVNPAQVRTELQVMNSAPVRDIVKDKLGVAPGVKVEQVGDTQVILIKAHSAKPRLAADVANAYAESYIDYRRKEAIDNLSQAGQAIQAKIDDLKRRIAEYDAANPPPPRPANGAPVPESPERSALESQRFFFEGRLDQLGVDVQLKNGGSQLVGPAAIPTSPVSPKPLRNGVLGVGVGLFFGTAFAFLLEHLDDSVNEKEDIERIARDVAVVGVIPAVGGWRNRGETRLVAKAEPSSPAAEAYRTLRTSIQFLALDSPLRVLQITSPTAGEGKSTTTANLAVTLCQAGLRVVILSCDLRRPRVNDFFGLPNSVGFTSVLLGQSSLTSALQRVPGVENLLVLASGPLPPNPSELLAGHRTKEVLAAISAQADMVLVDSPPVLPVTDAVVLASKVDGTLMVANAGSTSKRGLVRAFELLRQVDARLVGAVLNGASAEGAYGYAYYYRSDEDGSRKTSKKTAKKPAKKEAQV